MKRSSEKALNPLELKIQQTQKKTSQKMTLKPTKPL